MEVQRPNTIPHDAPDFVRLAVANQRNRQWAAQNEFYALIPPSYLSFYYNWLRNWLQWYDGYVPEIHGGTEGLLSTCIGTTIVNRTADIVFGGDIMFDSPKKAVEVAEIDGKKVRKALDFISNDWFKKVRGQAIVKTAGRMALAGGWSMLKLNKNNGELWLDCVRADRFYFEKAGSDLRHVVCALNVFENTVNQNDGRYVLVEDRHFEVLNIFGKEIPVCEYKIYRTFNQVQMGVNIRADDFLAWEDLPKSVKKAFKSLYGDTRLNKPQAMNGFTSLGCYLMYASDGVSNVPGVDLAESILSNVTTFLYEYDYYNTAFMTEMYLARGRVMLPKPMQSPNARSGNSPQGFDNFLFTAMPQINGNENKPQAVQFEMRSDAWAAARDNLLQSIATGIGLSVSTIASYLNDGGNRTAREVSAEESATTMFVEAMRRRWEIAINEMLADVLRFYGYIDDVEIRWTRAGMTNQTVMVEVLERAINAGLISQKKAHHQFNYDDDEEQNEEDFALVQKEREAQNEMPFNGMNYYGDTDAGEQTAE